MTFRLITILFILNGLNISAQTTISGGNVSGNWDINGSPYLIEGHILVPDNSTLSIAPGVTVEFQGHYKLFINGTLLASGTASDSILFTVAPDSISSGWWGIRFDSTPITNDSSMIEFCKIQHGNAFGIEDDARGGGICINNYSKVRIANSLITHNNAFREGGGIYCGNGSSPVIEYNTISHNTVEQSDGGGISIFNECHPIIRGNIIEFNTSESSGGGISTEYPCSATIEYNQIRNNVTNSAGGGIHCGYSGAHIIRNNVIEDNLAYGVGGGIFCYQNDESEITNNVIAFNTSLDDDNHRGGGGIHSNGGAHSIVNNHIVSNTSAAGGGGVFARGNVPIIGNVIANNTALLGGGIYLEYIGISAGSPKILNCTIANNLSTGSGINDGGGGLYCDQDRDPEIRNVIFHGNEAANGNGNDIYLLDNASDPWITYTNLPGGSNSIYTNGNPYTGVYSNNFDDDPMFQSATIGTGSTYDGLAADWTLQFNSPFIDVGSSNTAGLPPLDLAANARIVGSFVDLGAYEFQSNPTGVNNRIASHAINIYPNPTTGNAFIQLEDQSEIVLVRIFDNLGALVGQENPNRAKPVRCNLPESSGVYVIQTVNSDGVFNAARILKK